MWRCLSRREGHQFRFGDLDADSRKIWRRQEAQAALLERLRVACGREYLQIFVRHDTPRWRRHARNVTLFNRPHERSNA